MKDSDDSINTIPCVPRSVLYSIVYHHMEPLPVISMFSYVGTELSF